MYTADAAAPIRVLVVDDHAMVRDGIAALLAAQSDMEAVGEAADGLEAVARFDELRPDVTLMDLQMDQMSGLDAIAAIRALSPDARIVVLTTYAGDVQARAAIRAGASGYLLKNALRKELLDAIRTVHAGRRAMSADVAHDLVMHALDDPLTPRELAVLRLVAQGHGNKAIGLRLDLSTETIKSHLKSIFTKLDVDDRTHAVVVASRRGYLEG